MEALVNDLTAHNIQNRTVAIIENGSWAATSGTLIRQKLEKCKNIKLLEKTVSLKSSLKASQLSEIDEMADQLIATMQGGTSVLSNLGAGLSEKTVHQASPAQNNPAAENAVDMKTMFKLSYGLFLLTAKDGAKDNGCIINTVLQITEKPLRVTVAVNKANLTHDMILKTGAFNISILTESAPFNIFERFGFHSGKNTDKFAGDTGGAYTANGIRYLPEHTNGIISAKVKDAFDYGTHTLFVADVTQAFMLSDEPSVTYQYYFTHIKPKPQPPKGQKKGFVCKICGYVHEGETLPDDFICPLCKHGVADFEVLI
jgi:flavin reductase (DIM6/NTAB) family NADH-FMN oxidoreductase RutF